MYIILVGWLCTLEAPRMQHLVYREPDHQSARLLQVQHALKEQIASYATALGSAEQRFSDLEAVVRRMAARTVAGCC